MTPIEKGDIIATRLAAGEAPWDMLSLKAAINAASPGLRLGLPGSPAHSRRLLVSCNVGT